jgi:hypothetical protein
MRARLARIHRGARRAACSKPHADEQLRVATALLVHSWIRASIRAYPPRSANWRKVFAIAFARIHAAGGPRLLLESRCTPGACEGDDRTRKMGDTRRLAVH